MKTRNLARSTVATCLVLTWSILTTAYLPLSKQMSNRMAVLTRVLKPTPTPILRVGICLVGSVRSFQTSFVRENLRISLVEPLQREWGASVHTFGCLQLRDDPRIIGGESTPVTPSGAKKMLETLRSNYTFFTGKDFEPLNCSSQASSICASRGANRTFQAWTRLSFCYTELEKYEKTHLHGRYDWVVRARPDVVLLRPFPPLRAFSYRAPVVFVSAHHIMSISDHFWITRRMFSSTVFQCPMQHMKSGLSPRLNAPPEDILLHCLKTHQLKVVKMLDLPLAVVGFQKGLQCQRLNASLFNVMETCNNMTRQYLSALGSDSTSLP
jgi:hypothetical protein